MKNTLLALPACLLISALPFSRTAAPSRLSCPPPAAAAPAPVAAPTENTLSTAEINKGWKLLFDGSTTNGWHSYGQTKALAQWEAKDGALHLYLNGVNVVSTTLWDDNWKTLVAGSKFKRWPDFGTFKSGKIDLQDHNCEVWYRSIKIKEL